MIFGHALSRSNYPAGQWEEHPCASDYGVGLNSGIMSGGGIGSIVNRFCQIETELGTKARFSGKEGLKKFRSPQQ